MAPQLANRTLCVGRINPEALEEYNAAHFKGNEAPTLGVPETFHARFPVSVTPLLSSAFVSLRPTPRNPEPAKKKKKKKKKTVYPEYEGRHHVFLTIR